jgi:ADP-ribose pyrophosphatase YjhB (NUDIX family)
LEPVDGNELGALIASRRGAELEEIHLEVDEGLFTNRLAKSSDRRGEVVFAVQRPQGILVHRKSFYGDGVYRLPSGGIDYGEKVVDALRREIQEETSLTVSSERFLGAQDCHLHYGGRSVRFVSYVFYVPAGEGVLRPDHKEDIVGFRAVSPAELATIAEELREIPPPYEGWGRWRALAHDLVHRYLVEEAG